MKIVQINTVVGTGSVGHITANLYETSLANDIEAFVCFGRGRAPEGMRSVKVSNRRDMVFHVLRNFCLGESGFGSARKTEEFLRLLDQIRPDLIHLHNIHGFYLQVELLFTYIKEKKIPVVWTLHDCWPLTGHCAYFDYVECSRWKTGCCQCPQQRSAYPYALFKDNSIANYERKKRAFTGVENLTIVTPSIWLREIVRQSFLQEYPVEVIPNGIDLSVFKPANTRKQAINTEPDHEIIENGGKRQIHILGVANIWEKRKGLVYFEQLAQCIPDNYHITLVGLRKKQIRRLQRQESGGILPAGKIRGITRTENQTQLAQLYAAADVYVNTTLEDNFPTTNLEALASGTPVITFATGGSPEAIDPMTGAAVPKGNIEALCKAVREITDRPKNSAACVERARLYDKKIRFQEYIALYRKVLECGENKEYTRVEEK